ncbi:ABC transporter ATP-binding protein [Epibacterium sp. Ofav1-8]|uniref:ABC transporter ATP-binding protein n=1 Tax=Epibacterium sp. Ofav1-8 TaxID=2917735 RepID=UPI001EF3E5B7|nr:ABC transporter ATP-binding protein [Epibacterium sp. Ofav1-8]
MMAATLEARGLTWAPRRRGPLILHETSFHLPAGRVLGVVGANGAGKSSLLRLLYRYQSPRSGQVLVDGADLWAMPPRQAARRVAAVLQEQPTDFGLTVKDIVALGRLPHRDGLATSGQRDAAIIDSALRRLDLTGFSHRTLATLSGGERQRVMVARALAQEPQVLILDEPTNHMDVRHQLELLALIRNLDLTIVTSLHDLNLAAEVCDDMLLMSDGRVMGFGTPGVVLSETRVSQAFGVQARRDHLARAGRDHLTFHLSNISQEHTS